MNPYEQLIKEINDTVAETKPLTWFACQSCLQTYQAEQTPPRCPKCNAEVYQWPGDNVEQALERANRAIGTTTKAAPATPTAPEKKPRAIKVKPEPTPTPTPAAPAMAATEPASAPDTAEREARVAAFITKHGVTEFSPVPVGIATVQTFGFTRWNDKKPTFILMNPFQDAETFQKVFDQARAEQPSTQIDCALCSHVDNAELEACLYRGDLIASLNAGHGTTIVRAGQQVQIGAFKTVSNRLRFAVLKIIK
jgi:hypothetical protein